jgi:GT2 family glycosyltransferase
MKIAVIILNFNSSADCKRCITTLKEQEKVEIEMVVVDNCSTQSDEVINIERLCSEHHCTLLKASENRGYNAGNNIGLRYAAEKGYKYALIANPDMLFPQQLYLSSMIESMDKDEDIVACGSDIVGPKGNSQNPMKRDGDWRDSFDWMRELLRIKREFVDDFDRNHYCSKISGCCLMVRLSYMKEIGFFDENVFLYCEEAILSRQVERDHKRMFYLSDVRAIHNHVASQKGNPRKRFKYWIASRRYFERTYNNEGFLKNLIKTASWQLYECFYNLHNLLR